MERTPFTPPGGEFQDTKTTHAAVEHYEVPEGALYQAAEQQAAEQGHEDLADPTIQHLRERLRFERNADAGLHEEDAALVESGHSIRDERARPAAVAEAGEPVPGYADVAPPGGAGGNAEVQAVQHQQPADEAAAREQPGGETSLLPRRIREGVGAVQAGQQVDDRTARDIARYFRTEEDGPLASFIACGAIWNDDDELHEELFGQWQQHSEEEQAWAEALRSYCAQRESELPVSHWCKDRGEREGTRSGMCPEIWVGSLLDYNNGLLHGMWIDADQEPDEMKEQIRWILRTSPAARSTGEVAEEWAILDHGGFCGYEVDEWSSLDTISLIAQGIAEHGEAYAAWVEYVGDTAGELTSDEAFLDHYLGTWESVEAYVEEVLQETGFYGQLEERLAGLPDDVRRNIQVDVAGIAQEWEQGLHLVEGTDGGVLVFSAR